MFVKPRAGVKVRDESMRFLPEEGAEVLESTWWTRKLQDGDVFKCEPPALATPPNHVLRVEPIPDSAAKESATSMTKKAKE